MVKVLLRRQVARQNCGFNMFTYYVCGRHMYTYDVPCVTGCAMLGTRVQLGGVTVVKQSTTPKSVAAITAMSHGDAHRRDSY